MGASVPPALLFLGVVLLQRLVELVIARRNTARLLARGGREVGRAHYRLIVAVHVSWLAALLLFARDSPVSLVWLGMYAGLQVLRIWIIGSLGPRWTTRIIVIDAPPVRRGPYRCVRHPNYLLVVAEIAVVPLALGQPWIAALFTILNAGVLRIRIAEENAALGYSASSPAA
jgi:methyltransferase